MRGPIADRELLYSPLSFLRGREQALVDHVHDARQRDVAGGSTRVVGTSARWFVRELAWDTAHFGIPFLRLAFAEWDEGRLDPATRLAHALADVRESAGHPEAYVFAEVPAEDLPVVQALGLAGYRLIETRATYYRDDLAAFAPADRWPVRAATVADIDHLSLIARDARNPFDRYHADPAFSQEAADRYLATYVAESVRGLADVVLVPDTEDGAAPGAFFTVAWSRAGGCPLGTDHRCPLDLVVGRIVLVAVGPDRRGWHLRLLSESTLRFKEHPVDIACMTTQITNRAVVRNSETLGYRLGRITHVFSSSTDVPG